MPGSASEGAGQPGGRSVGLVVNSYERTYRDVLRPGFFPGVAAQNGRDFDEVVALVNNVADRRDATARAEELVRTGEISAYAFVADLLPAALHSARLSARALRRRPYLLDYGLVMPHVVGTRWLLGWDAETRLPVPTDWVSPSLDLLAEHPRVFHVSLGWTVGPGNRGPSVRRSTTSVTTRSAGDSVTSSSSCAAPTSSDRSGGRSRRPRPSGTPRTPTRSSTASRRTSARYAATGRR